MEQIEVITRKGQSPSLHQLKSATNDWLKEHRDKEIVHISIGPWPSGEGSFVMIRYREPGD